MNEEGLRDIVSNLAKIDPGQLSAATPLNGPLGGSFGRARLDANLRSRFGVCDPSVYSVNTFGELCAVLGVGTSSNTSPPTDASSQTVPLPLSETHATRSGVVVGTDVESVSAMPEAADYWEDVFYKTTFTSREIAHALLRPSPRASFAAMWCAKEALRKTDASLANADWRMIEVIHDELGKPSLLVNGRQPPGDLSLSHTDEFALAVFVSAQLPQLPAPVIKGAAPPAPTPAKHISPVASFIAFLALLLSIAAFVMSFLHR